MRSLFLFFAVACAACAPEQRTVEISFDVRLNDEPISCSAAVAGLRLTDLRMYVADIRLKGAGSKWQPLIPTSDDIWQSEEVVLIDLESGEGACLNGSSEINAVIRGATNADPATGLAFSIGVPESLNHADPLSAAAPLGYSEMHWHWATGYKFLRAGVAAEDDGFFLHLGSNRCEGTTGNIKGCRGANRVAVELSDFNVGENVVVLDIGALFADVDLQDGQTSKCMSGPANNDCETPFRSLGIDFQSGESRMSAPAFRSGLPK